jgi:hypothetical protein
MTTVPPRTVALWLDTGLPFEKRCPRQEGGGSECKIALGSPLPSRRRRNGGASSPVSKQLPWHETAFEVERILMVDFASIDAQANEVAPSASHEGGPDRGRSGQTPAHLTSTYRRQGGQVVPLVGGHPRHHHLTTHGVHPLAPSRPNC